MPWNFYVSHKITPEAFWKATDMLKAEVLESTPNIIPKGYNNSNITIYPNH
jgi:hypothetical protein